MKILLLFAFLTLQIWAMAQSSLFDSVNRKRYQMAGAGFIVLGSWAALNISAGLIGRQNASGEQKQFFKANTIGGVVDLAFAGVGYFTNRHMARKSHDVKETLQKQVLAEKVFLFSVGLDLTAFIYGYYTKERANRFAGEKRERLKGAGNALILQGVFLTLFDGILYMLQVKNGQRLLQRLKNLSFSGTKNGAGFVYRF